MTPLKLLALPMLTQPRRPLALAALVPDQLIAHEMPLGHLHSVSPQLVHS